MAAERTGSKHAKKKSWAAYLGGSIQFLCTLPTKAILHKVVDGVLNKMMKDGEEDLVDYATSNVFRFNRKENMWDAPWYSGMLGAFPSGLTPVTVSQAMESMWDVLRGTLPGGAASMDMAASQEALKQALRAVFSARHWIDHHGHLVQQAGGLPPWHYDVFKPLQRMLTGEAVYSERDPGAGGEQCRVPAMVHYARHAPDNYQRSKVNGGPWEEYAHVYTMPLKWPDLPVDEETHRLNLAILQAEEDQELVAPLTAARVGALRLLQHRGVSIRDVSLFRLTWLL